MVERGWEFAVGKRIAFVIPRCGVGVYGGNEVLTTSLAVQLRSVGVDAQILTTCAKDNRTWENEFPPGADQFLGVPVRRFPVDARDLDIWIPLQTQVAQGIPLTLEEQFTWLSHGVNSQELYSYIAAQASRFDALIFTPYLFGTTFWGSLIAPERSLLLPCLHDEEYAYVPVIQAMFQLVGRALFNSVPEQELASRLYGEIAGGSVGMGFEQLSRAERDSLTPYFENTDPYVLYLGRKETGKGAQCLIDAFVAAKERFAELAPLRLVIAGGGSFDDLLRPAAKERSDIIDVCSLSETEKQRLLRHALLLAQPSLNESFSIVLMESWLVERPVVVNAHCQVTRHHVEQSGGGLYYATGDELGEVLRYLYTHQDVCDALGREGRRYVDQQYSWSAVMARLQRVLASLMAEVPQGGEEAAHGA